jgi:hypothetical protein
MAIEFLLHRNFTQRSYGSAFGITNVYRLPLSCWKKKEFPVWLWKWKTLPQYVEISESRTGLSSLLMLLLQLVLFVLVHKPRKSKNVPSPITFPHVFMCVASTYKKNQWVLPTDIHKVYVSIPCTDHQTIESFSGWWFGKWILWFWECHHPNWRTPSFFRGVGLNHQPVFSALILIRTRKTSASRWEAALTTDTDLFSGRRSWFYASASRARAILNLAMQG